MLTFNSLSVTYHLKLLSFVFRNVYKSGLPGDFQGVAIDSFFMICDMLIYVCLSDFNPVAFQVVSNFPFGYLLTLCPVFSVQALKSYLDVQVDYVCFFTPVRFHCHLLKQVNNICQAWPPLYACHGCL